MEKVIEFYGRDCLYTGMIDEDGENFYLTDFENMKIKKFNDLDGVFELIEHMCIDYDEIVYINDYFAKSLLETFKNNKDDFLKLIKDYSLFGNLLFDILDRVEI